MKTGVSQDCQDHKNTHLKTKPISASISVVAVVLAFINFWQPPTPWLRQGQIYVSPTGSDWNLGHSPNTALKTIQTAANRAAPGETIVILPGTYREDLRIRNSGRPNQPITFRAQIPGTVTLTNAALPQVVEALTWKAEGDNLWSTQTPWPIYAVRNGESALYHVRWGGVPALRQLTAKPNAYAAFTYDPPSQRLYVFLPDGQPPDTHPLAIHRSIPPPREWGNSRVANAWIEADYIHIEGLRFDLGVGSNVVLWNAKNIFVTDCLFTGSAWGVSHKPQIQATTAITLKNNLYHNYPQYYWLRDWLSWQEVYAHYANSSLISSSDPSLTVAHNIVTHGGDALQISPRLSQGATLGAEVYENLLIYGTDDAIEFDGSAQNVHVHHNLVYEGQQNLGLSPVLTGPVLIENNRFLHPANGVNGSQLKLLNPWYDPNDPNPDPIQNVEVRDNIFVGRYLAYWGPPVKNIQIHDNTFAVQGMKDPPWHPGITVSQNEMILLPPDDYPNPGQNPAWIEDWQMSRPGPRWLHYPDHPATRDIPEKLSPNLFTE